jgi:pimeloyl-ACP methyl ester carboxylesterase
MEESAQMECRVQDIPIYYETVGTGRPFLMLHGGFIDHRHILHDLEPIFAAHPGWQRIYPDLPGHGRTPAPDWLVRQDQVLEIVLGFIDQVIGSERFAVAGVSRGGYLARGVLARRAPDVDGALLITPARYGAAPVESLPQKVVLEKDEGMVAELNPAEADLLTGYVVQDRRALAGSRRNLVALELTDQAFQKRIFEDYEFSFDVDQTPPSFDKPVLILAGRQDAVVGYLDAWKTLTQFPRASFAVLDRAGHYLPTEQEGLLRALAEEWLQRVEGYPIGIY